MFHNLKTSKFYIGIALLVQAFTFLILFLLLYSKNKSVAKTLLIFSAAGGIAGSFIIFKSAYDARSNPHFAVMDAFCDCSDDIDSSYSNNDSFVN